MYRSGELIQLNSCLHFTGWACSHERLEEAELDVCRLISDSGKMLHEILDPRKDTKNLPYAELGHDNDSKKTALASVPVRVYASISHVCLYTLKIKLIIHKVHIFTHENQADTASRGLSQGSLEGVYGSFLRKTIVKILATAPALPDCRRASVGTREAVHIYQCHSVYEHPLLPE